MSRDILTVQAAEQNVSEKISSHPQAAPGHVPPRKSVPRLVRAETPRQSAAASVPSQPSPTGTAPPTDQPPRPPLPVPTPAETPSPPIELGDNSPAIALLSLDFHGGNSANNAFASFKSRRQCVTVARPLLRDEGRRSDCFFVVLSVKSPSDSELWGVNMSQTENPVVPFAPTDKGTSSAMIDSTKQDSLYSICFTKRPA